MIDFYFINRIFLFLVIVGGLWVAFLIFIANRKSKINQYFSFSVIALILFNVFGYFSHNNNQIDQILLLKKLFFIAIFFFLISIYIFSVYFPKVDKRYPLIDIIIVVTELLFLFLTIFSDFIVKDVEIESWGTNIIFGKGKYFLFGTMILYTFLIVGQIIKKYFILNAKEKLQAQYFLIGIVIFAVANLIFNMFYPLFQNTYKYHYAGDYSAIIFLGFTAYAIVKHELMGIKTLLTQVLITVISIVLLIDVVTLSNNLTIQLLKIGILIAFLYFSRELIKSVKREKEARGELECAYDKINQYVGQLEQINTDLAERNEDLKAIFETSGKASETLDPKLIAQNIVDSIPKSLKHLGYVGGFIVAYDKKENLLSGYTITESRMIRKARQFLTKSYDKYTQKASEADNMIIKTIHEKKVVVGEKLFDFINPTLDSGRCGLIQGVLRAKCFISVPLFARGKVIGVIVFIGRNNVGRIRQRDKDLLYMFSSHIGGAIENARLYEQTSQQMKELDKLNRKLENANENLKELLEMKNEFLHITSHQLRTPLTAIRGMLSMWYEGDFDNLSETEKREILKRIYLSTERLNNITNDMLDALEVEGGLLKLQLNDAFVQDIVKETIDTLKTNYDAKGLYINLNAEDNLPKAKVELNYIRQVFMNVIDNASKYTKKGGVDITIKKNGKYVETIVKDTGIGASPEDQKKLFEKFSRGKNAVKENASGSGLGLFIAKKIVEKHHGKMSFESEGVGKGSTITIDIPANRGGD